MTQKRVKLAKRSAQSYWLSVDYIETNGADWLFGTLVSAFIAERILVSAMSVGTAFACVRNER